MRNLKIPADKVHIVGLGKDNKWKISGETSDQEIFIPNEMWMDWSLLLQKHPSDEAFFVCCGSAPYRIFYAGNWPSFDAMMADHCNDETVRHVYNPRPLAMFIIDAAVAAQWLIDNPYEVTHGCNQ